MNNKKQDKLETLRHSAAHILAMAVLEMFPEAKFAIGPSTEDGFYYDFDLPRTLIPEDLPLLEEKMRAIIKANHPFEKSAVSADKALELFKRARQDYKVELINDLVKEEKHPKFRPPYMHILSLAEIIQIALGAKNVQAPEVQTLWRNFVDAFGNEIKRKALPMSAGLKILYPSPPKNCFVMTTAITEPIIGTWIVNGLNDQREEGRFMPSSKPVRNALPSLIVSFFLTAF